MTAAGDAVLAEARRWIGITEQPPGSNAGPWWDNFGGNYGSWCAAFVSMVVNNALGYPSMCQIDSEAGFMLVSNGVYHQYVEPNGDSATGLEAQRTVDLQPGDIVNYSWENWRWEGTPGQGGYPVCDGGAYDGWTAGDHTGIVASTVDGNGYFRAVEGNTSDTDSGSQDNGGGCYEKTRHISQVCGWQRPVVYGGTTPEPEDEMTEADFDRITWIVHETVLGLWREQEMANLDTERADVGSHRAGEDIMRSDENKNLLVNASFEAASSVMRSDENANIIEAACRRALG